MTIILEDRIDELLKSAYSSGKFGMFRLDNVSYYPAARVQDKICWNIYGKSSKEAYGQSDAYREMEKRSDARNPPNIDRPLAHTDVEGDFFLLYQEDVYCGILNIRRINDKIFPELNISIISGNALYPNKHVVKRFSNTSIYTIDEDGSSWSLHLSIPF